MSKALRKINFKSILKMSVLVAQLASSVLEMCKDKKMPLGLNDFELRTLRRLFDAQRDDDFVAMTGLSGLLLEDVARERDGNEIPEAERKDHAKKWDLYT